MAFHCLGPGSISSKLQFSKYQIKLISLIYVWKAGVSREHLGNCWRKKMLNRHTVPVNVAGGLYWYYCTSAHGCTTIFRAEPLKKSSSHWCLQSWLAETVSILWTERFSDNYYWSPFLVHLEDSSCNVILNVAFFQTHYVALPGGAVLLCVGELVCVLVLWLARPC